MEPSASSPLRAYAAFFLFYTVGSSPGTHPHASRLGPSGGVLVLNGTTFPALSGLANPAVFAPTTVRRFAK